MIIADLADEQEHLTELYEDVTSCIPVLLENNEGLPLSEIYAPLLIEEDLDAMKKTRRPDEPSGSKRLDNVQGVFYVRDRDRAEKLSTRILIKGEAGSGKSVFCLKLVESWSRIKQFPKHEHVCEKPSELIHRIYHTKYPCTTCEMRQCLSQFDLLYYVPLRDATEGKTSVVDMICDVVCNDCPDEIDRTKRLLSNKNVHCLIVLDGVDEWPHPPGYTELPNTRGLSMKCVLLWTMRPWKLVHLQLKPKHDNHIVTVCGLTPYSVENVIEKILVKLRRNNNDLNMGLHATVWWQGYRGLTLAKAPQCLRHLANIGDEPKVIVVHCGAWNDLGQFSIRTTMIVLIKVYDPLKSLFPNARLIWSHAIPQSSWRYARDTKAIDRARQRLNRHATKTFSQSGLILRHTQFDGNSYLHPDGVHLSSEGNQIFCQNIKEVIQSLLSQ